MKAMISLIAATANEGVIGDTKRYPLWNLPADLRYFKRVTMNNPVIMGRKTHELIGRPLAGRQNIVISHQENYQAEGCLVVNSLEAAISSAHATVEIFILGGGQIFAQALPVADMIYLTEIKLRVPGDIIFKFDRSQWQEIWREEHAPDNKNKHAYTFYRFKRIAGRT